jgi:hypothetical protein
MKERMPCVRYSKRGGWETRGAHTFLERHSAASRPQRNPPPRRLVQPVRDRSGWSSRAFNLNPVAGPDLVLFTAVLRGEHTSRAFGTARSARACSGPPPLPITGAVRTCPASSNGSTCTP